MHSPDRLTLVQLTACSACSTLEIRHQHGGDEAGADDDDTHGRGSVRYTYALQHQQGGGSSASSDGSSGHVLFQAGSTGIGRLWIRAGGAARTAHARVAAEASTVAASCLPPAQTLTPRFWELEVVGIGASDVVGTVEKRPYFYVLGPTYMLVSDFFFAFSSKSRNPARALGGPLPGAPAPWRRHLVRFPRHFAGLGVRCPPLVLRDQRLGSFCACQRPPSIANQQTAPHSLQSFFSPPGRL